MNIINTKTDLTYARNLILFTSMVCLISLGLRCKKVKHPVKPTQFSSSNGLTNLIAGATIAAGIYVVTDQSLRDKFENSDKSKPIKPKFKNKLAMKFDFQLSFDGNSWFDASIDPNEMESFKSGDKGLIGLKFGDKKMVIEESNTYIFEESNGDVNIYTHGSY